MELRGLVDELDRKLAPERALARVQATARQQEQRTLRPWLGIAVVMVLIVAASIVAMRPWQNSCIYVTQVCEVAELDIDALRVTIPGSDVMAALPNIDSLDPTDELTAGDIFAMERFAHINFEDLFTDEEFDLLLGAS